MDFNKKSLELHRKLGGKLEIKSKASLETREDLSVAYTPGVAEPCREIAKDKSKVFEYTIKKNTVAVVTDGSAVLGLGNIGPEAALPVMEGKAILFKEFAGVDAFPICLATQDTEEIIKAIRQIAPVFGGINLEDIAAPRCFEIEERLQDLGIPVFHDDQHGTAIVVAAALLNACKATGKEISKLKVVVSGAGAAGIAIAKRLLKMPGEQSVNDILLLDSKGIIYESRGDLNKNKLKIARLTNHKNLMGGLAEAMRGADVFIGVSTPGILTKEMVTTMAPNSIIFAMANPTPEIMPELAKAAGASIVATGRSDFPNQVNNVLAFPGVFRGALDARATQITEAMKIAAIIALSKSILKPTVETILPSPLDKTVSAAIAIAVRESANNLT